LALGRYEVVFTYRAEATAGSWGEPAGEIDVLVNVSRVVAPDQIIPCGNTLRVSRHIFEVKSPDEEYQFRVKSNGIADVYLYALTLQGVTPRAPDRLDEIGLIGNGQRPEVGAWSMDPIFCRAAWFGPAGSAGNMHTGPLSKLVPGNYEAKFVLRPANHTPSIAGTVDIGESSGRIVWSQDFSGADGRLQVIRHEFNALASDGLFQSRVSIAGSVGVYLFGVTVEPVVIQ
jgi:hypothetical protein